MFGDPKLILTFGANLIMRLWVGAQAPRPSAFVNGRPRNGHFYDRHAIRPATQRLKAAVFAERGSYRRRFKKSCRCLVNWKRSAIMNNFYAFSYRGNAVVIISLIYGLFCEAGRRVVNSRCPQRKINIISAAARPPPLPPSIESHFYDRLSAPWQPIPAHSVCDYYW